MTIYEQLLSALRGREGDTLSRSEIKNLMAERFGRNPGSVIPSDYCYNRTNEGIAFDKHLFEWLGRGEYRFLGEDHPYSGPVVWNPADGSGERIVGEWRDGQLTWHDPTFPR